MSRSSAERQNKEQKKTISATIGYCFVIVLVVLFVMSGILTKTYLQTLQVERSESMKSVAVACSVAMSHSEISENMSWPLPVYTYGENKPYIFDIYIKAGNSFLRMYTSSDSKDLNEYTLSGLSDNASEDYNNCFEQQIVTLTTRTENGVRYKCAIAPIISSQNTVAGLLEVRMPESDFTASVNGMSLSWIFTIFSIAVSAGIIIYEFNLLISTLSKGIRGNVPVLIMYGKDACKFVSFFFSFAAVMQPVVIATYLKKSLAGQNRYIIYALIALAILFYAIGFFGFSGLRRSIKSKLTSKIALLVMTVLGYFFSLLTGFINIPYLTVFMALPIAICSGIAHDFLRDYRINAAQTGYEGFEDRTIHKVQSISYYLGISVGTVLAGIFFERFGLLVVMIVSGACLILSALAMTYMMRNNNIVRESFLPINTWMEIVTNKYTGKMLLSGIYVLGFIFAFMIGFVPNFLGTVGISIPTASFYYLLCAFIAAFVMEIVKRSTYQILASKVRVLISSSAVILGLAIFALLPTAKILVVTCALFGVSLGIHDYTYLYTVARLAKDRIHGNLRKAAEATFLFALIITVPVLTASIAFDYTRIILLVVTLILAVVSFIYPISSVSNIADEAMFSKKKKQPKNTVSQTSSEGGNSDGNVE